MHQELLGKFKQAQKMNLSLDVQDGVMEHISSSRKRHPLFLPTLVALTLITVLMIGFPLANPRGPEQIQEEPAKVVIERPRYLTLYPSPYRNLEILRLMKGSETL